MNLPPHVTLREVGPRDGFQSLKTIIATADKMDIIAALIDAGITRMETTSFVSPSAIPQLKDAAEVMAGVKREGVIHAAMVPNATGAERALAAGVDELVAVMSASEGHNQANVGRCIDKSLSDLDTIFSQAQHRSVPVIGSIAVAFGCPYQGAVPFNDVAAIASAYIEKGADSIMLADTVGMATPIRVHRMVENFRKRFGDKNLILHFHNNRGVAMANLFAAVTVGVTHFDTSVGGIGGCPNVPSAAGNLATEDVVFMLEDMGINTGIDLAKLIEAAKLLEKHLGQKLPGQLVKSGPVHSKVICD